MNQAMNWLLNLLLSLPAILLSLSLREMCRGYVALKLGDPTAKISGRLSMNPLQHIDPIGFIMLLFFHVGWSKPFVIDYRNLKNPKRDIALISLAGPLSNLILSFIAVFVYVFLIRIGLAFSIMESALFWGALQVVYYVAIIGLGLSVFHFLPIPPLDGSKILFAFLPYHIVHKILRYERYISFVLLLLLFLDILSVPINAIVSFFFNLFLTIAQGVIF
jgi:Zn-dependent protease